VSSYKFIGEVDLDYAGSSVSYLGDVDGDGIPDLLVAAMQNADGGSGAGKTYLISGADLAAVDSADGSRDGIVSLTNVAAQSGSYTFIGEDADDFSGSSISSAGDVDGDGLDDLLIGARGGDGGGAGSGETYLITAADLAAADAADGSSDGVIDLGNVAGQGLSYKFIGIDGDDQAGYAVSSAGDTDGDGLDDLLIGADRAGGGGTDSGETYLIAALDLAAADAADGSADGVIDLANVAPQSASYTFVGEDGSDFAGASVASAGDFDGDGLDDLLIGASRADGSVASVGKTYLVSAADLAAADAADGSDGVIDLANVAAQTNSFTFTGEGSFDFAGASITSLGDVDGDTLNDFLIAASFDDDGGVSSGGAYLITSADLTDADAADGSSDGNIDLGNVAAQSTSYQFVGEEAGDAAGTKVSYVGDVDGDGLNDLLISASRADDSGSSSGATYLLTAADLAAADAADGSDDGIIDLSNAALQSSSYKFIGESGSDFLGASVSSAGDFDSDGLDDLLIGAHLADDAGFMPGATYLVSAADLADADAADGNTDGIINMANVAMVSCFAPGTRIRTPYGECSVEDLRIGDLVSTVDHGPQPLRWIGIQTVSFTDPQGTRGDRDKPILIGKGSLSPFARNTAPERDLVVSPQHRMLLSGKAVFSTFREKDVLAIAKSLTDLRGVRRMHGKRAMTYYALLFDRHEVIWAEGAKSESLRPGPCAMRGFTLKQRQEIYKVYKDLKAHPVSGLGPSARPLVPRQRTAQMIAATQLVPS
jgi:hypothetical protein